MCSKLGNSQTYLLFPPPSNLNERWNLELDSIPRKKREPRGPRNRKLNLRCGSQESENPESSCSDRKDPRVPRLSSYILKSQRF